MHIDVGKKYHAMLQAGPPFESFLGILPGLSAPSFSSIILFHMFVQAFDTLKIPHHFGTRDTLKKVVCLSISRACNSCMFSLVMPISHESENTKLLIISLLLAVFYLQSPSCEVIYKSQGDLNSSNSNFFTMCPPWSISIALLC